MTEWPLGSTDEQACRVLEEQLVLGRMPGPYALDISSYMLFVAYVTRVCVCRSVFDVVWPVLSQGTAGIRALRLIAELGQAGQVLFL